MSKKERRLTLAALIAVGLSVACLFAFSSQRGARDAHARAADDSMPTRGPVIDTMSRGAGPSSPGRPAEQDRSRPPREAPAPWHAPRDPSSGDERSIDRRQTESIPPIASPVRHEPSPRSETRGDITFENTCSVPLELFWVDFDGALRWYGYVGRGSVVTMPSFEGHRWVVRERGSSRELATARVGEGDGHLEVCAEGDALRDPTPPPPTPPGGPPRRCTTDDGPATTLLWTNACDVPVELFWIDRTCERRPYRTLAPGESRTQSTFVHHVWRAETPEGRVLFEQAADADAPHWILRCDAASSFTAAP